MNDNNTTTTDALADRAIELRAEAVRLELRAEYAALTTRDAQDAWLAAHRR